MVRNMGNKISSNQKNYNPIVYSTSGLTISSAAKQSRSILSDHGQGDVAVVQVTNDVQDSSKSELVELYKSLIDTIKRVAPKAKHIICAVPHRLGAENVELNKKIDYLNDKLQSICAEDPGLNFVNFNPELSVRNYNNDYNKPLWKEFLRKLFM